MILLIRPMFNVFYALLYLFVAIIFISLSIIFISFLMSHDDLAPETFHSTSTEFVIRNENRLFGLSSN